MTEAGFVEIGTGEAFGQNRFEPWVFFFDGFHRAVDDLSDLRLLGGGLEPVPAGVCGNPEDSGGEILIPVFEDGLLLGVVTIDEVVVLRVVAELLKLGAT